MPDRLQGKVALITGAGCLGPGWGNGRATAAIFGQEGARVFAVDSHRERLHDTIVELEASGCEFATDICDVTNSQSVATMVAACIARFGRIDVLVNNVGGGGPSGGPKELPEDVWDFQIDLNLKSVFLVCKHVLPHMEAQRSGVIINTSSAAALRWTGNTQIAYAASKAGVIQMSRLMAVDGAAKGIRVNTVIPGQLNTPLVRSRIAGNQGGDIDALLAKRESRIPLGFMGDGRDTAYASLFLASDEARFITGTEILLDGGMTIRCA
jgi:NAD(P)-dependent dehydrogenase (short-subunit alcohol dehydrogenase family)